MSDSSDIARRICLGTAQLGMDYGLANALGRPSDKACSTLLARAIERGVLRWDTARSYGDAESRIGRFLADCPRCDDVHIVSKVPRPPQGLRAKYLARWLTDEVDTSLSSLRTNRIADLLIHDATTVREYGEAIWAAMLVQIERGVVERIGLSVYDLDELQRGLEQPRTAAVQFPMNLLDHRFSESTLLETAVERGITLYARSVLLQGALAMTAAGLPSGIEQLAGPLRELAQLLRKYDTTCLEVALPFVLSHQKVDYVVIGVDDVVQLNENLDLAEQRMPAGLADELRSTFRTLPAEVLEPRRW